eukprot:357631-Chlamydomonas_euryale.AAC.5
MPCEPKKVSVRPRLDRQGTHREGDVVHRLDGREPRAEAFRLSRNGTGREEGQGKGGRGSEGAQGLTGKAP